MSQATLFLEKENIAELHEDEVLPFQYSITSYGADYPVDSLVKRLNEETIYTPGFQREFVWTINDASRFIESLLGGLPVPGIFLSRERETGKMLVIDGQQRLKSLQYFYSGVFEPSGKAFELTGIKSRFSGLTCKRLKPDDRLKLDDSIIHATIVKQDEPSEDDSSIYHIFERLNTGGKQLLPQEIRASIYHGVFNDLLELLNLNSQWRSIYGPVSKFLRDEELILRFIALYFASETYQQPMKGFLNKFMNYNRRMEKIPADRITNIFIETIAAIHEATHDLKPFRLNKRALNAAVFDAVMIGIARRIEGEGDPLEPEELRAAYVDLLSNKDFIAASSKATANEKTLARRIEIATDYFQKI